MLTICPICKATYMETQRDGTHYQHGCPPLSEWEKRALKLSLTDTVERTDAQATEISAAIAATGVTDNAS